MTDRLFFALWPDDALRTELGRRIQPLLEGCRCRPQRPDQWHATLEFIGPVPRDRQPALHEAAAEAMAGPELPAVLRFDRCEYWPKPQVLCLVASVTPPDLATRVSRLRNALAARGFPPESRPFRPHVTVARKAREAGAQALLEPPLAWPVGDLVLVRSVTDPSGSRYEPVARWNVSRPPPA